MTARPKSRRGFAHAGFVRFDEQTYPCTVTDMSSTGATLTFKLHVELPPRFTLQLTLDGMVVRSCAVTWDEGKQVGVLFERDAS